MNRFAEIRKKLMEAKPVRFFIFMCSWQAF